MMRIPDDWTTDEAIAVVAFLEHVISAIWSAHGDKMGDRLLDPTQWTPWPPPDLDVACTAEDDPEDDIPF
jgi:hypothetical protein